MKADHSVGVAPKLSPSLLKLTTVRVEPSSLQLSVWRLARYVFTLESKVITLWALQLALVLLKYVNKNTTTTRAPSIANAPPIKTTHFGIMLLTPEISGVPEARPLDLIVSVLICQTMRVSLEH